MLNFAHLLQEANRLKETIKDRVTRRATLLSPEESRKSIEMADSLKTLTQLAFIFVPLSLASSIFGVNVRQFGSGTAPLWTFIVTVLLIGIVTGTLWWSTTGGRRRYLSRFSRGSMGYLSLLFDAPTMRLFFRCTHCPTLVQRVMRISKILA
jgi:hypothetical protein